MQAQGARTQQQRVMDRQESKIEQLKASLAKRDAELVAQRVSAQQMQDERTAAESWLDH